MDHTRTPLLTRPPIRPIPADMPSLIGLKRDQLTVIGLYAVIDPKKSKHGTWWVCRCTCGAYALRRTQKLKKPGHDACVRCHAAAAGQSPGT